MNKKLLNGILYTIFSILGLALPTLILIYIKRDEWITVETGTSISIGVMIGLAYVLLLMRGALKDIDKRIVTLLSMFVFLGIVWFIDAIIADLFWIISSAIVGYILYLILSLIGRKDLNYYKSYKDERARVYARNEVNQEIGNV